MRDFRTFLQEYEKAHPDLVFHIWDEVDAKWEASAIGLKAQKEMREPPLLIFHRVRTADGRISPHPLVVNPFASRERCAFATGSNPKLLGRELYERRAARVKPVVIPRAEAPVKHVVKTGDSIDLCELPAIVHAAWDPGPYLSAGFITTYDPISGVDNSALQRGWLSDRREIRFSAGGWSHNGRNFSKARDRGDDARMVFWVGHHPAVYIGAEAKLGYPESHWEAAGGMIGEPLRLVASETLGDDFLVPADAEYVIEGFVRNGSELKPEGPFGEYTRYFGSQRLRPCMDVTCVTHREEPYWFTIIPGYGDDAIGGLRREGHIFDLLKHAVPEVTNVYRPAICPLYFYVQLHKTADWQPRSIISAALSIADSIKYVFVFDEDVDIFDEYEVHWAIGTRSDWARDIVVLENAAPIGLEPNSSGGGTTRAGIDCTKPAPPAKFEQRSFIPAETMAEIRLSDYLRPRAGE
ncbi:MAG: UbiD family decarboxylase [Chloroflexi bacterium]|nr:UbiD family decarboxylase [Chloroflexota bacterium]